MTDRTCENQVIELYCRGYSVAHVSKALNLRYGTVRRIVKKYGVMRKPGYCCLKPARHQMDDYGADVPSPAEVRQRCRQIRDSWDEETEQARRAAPESKWTPPVATFCI